MATFVLAVCLYHGEIDNSCEIHDSAIPVKSIDHVLQPFDLNANPNLNRAYINELADCRFIEENVAVLIAGPCGTGKSHLAQDRF